MDFRFKYRRRPLSPEEQAGSERRERDTVLRMRGLAIGMSIPMSLAAGPLAGWLLGSWLDRWLGTAYWSLVLILLGTAAGLKLVIDMLIALSRER